MSTTFDLLVQKSDDVTITLDITEASAQFYIAITVEGVEEEPPTLDTLRMTADETINAALKMLNVVLYSYPEKMPEIITKLQQLRY